MNHNKPIPVTAVFDIGKTNKKFLLFDEAYTVVHSRQESFREISDDDGDPCEDIGQIVAWAERTLLEALADERYHIRAVNFSTYGASFVHQDRNGKIVAPLYNYLKPLPPDIPDDFYEAYGGKEQFALRTASPPMGMLNSGLQLYWLKKVKPETFRKIKYSLHLPQFLSHIFTGKYYAELTSIGCHTALWDFRDRRYHPWVQAEDIRLLFPGIEDVSKTDPVSYKGHSFKAGIGIHDSSAALAPWLLVLDKPFLLLSTGTWSIAFNPFNREPMAYEELEKDCLCYMNIKGEQVKASRFFLGSEYAHQKKKLEKHFSVNGRSGTEILPDEDLISRLITEEKPEQKLVLERAHRSGPRPAAPGREWNSGAFASFEEGYHRLLLDLVDIQAESVELAMGQTPVDKIIVTGGFSKNKLFIKLLASRFPGKEIYTAGLSNSTALGAAMVINEEEQQDPGRRQKIKDLLDLRLHRPLGVKLT